MEPEVWLLAAELGNRIRLSMYTATSTGHMFATHLIGQTGGNAVIADGLDLPHVCYDTPDS